MVSGALVLAMALTGAAHAQTGVEAGVAAALERAVRDRVDARAEVRVAEVRVTWATTPPAGEMRASLEPNQRLGRPLRFLVYDNGPSAQRRAVGAAQAAVVVHTPLVRAARAVARGTVLAVSDVVELWDAPTGIPVGRLPLMTQVVGAQATRDLAVGVLVTPHTIRQLPIVRPGDELVARASVGGIEVTGKAIAHQAGRLGEVIRVVNADSGRPLHARVVGPREVEVEHVR
jgi:flagella basal body P-ring formation protein FlgA